MIVFYICLAIVVLLLMVLIHELGHYVVGRWLGFRITEFSIGFGKAIWQKTNKRGEKISLRIFPLGGYCAFYGEDGEVDEEDEKADKEKNKNEGKQEDVKIDPNDPSIFTNQKPWKRIIVFFAGVVFNFISAIIFSFILLLAFGYGNVYKVVDVNPYFQENYTAGTGLYLIEKGDIITHIDGTRVDYVWEKTIDKLTTAEENNVYTLTVQKANSGEIIQVELKMMNEVSADYNEETGTYQIIYNEDNVAETYIGLGLSMGLSSQPLSFWEALSQCFMFTIGLAWMVLKTFWLLITFQLPLSSLGGTITVISTVAETVQQSFSALFIYLPLIAANLAVFNILPFPALDGSHVAFTTIEWIRGKPVNRNIETWVHFIGFVILIAFVILIDIIHFLPK